VSRDHADRPPKCNGLSQGAAVATTRDAKACPDAAFARYAGA